MKNQDKAVSPKHLNQFVQVLVPSKISNARAAKYMDSCSTWHHAWRIGKKKGDAASFSCIPFVRFHRPLAADFKKMVALGVRGKLTMVTVWQYNKSIKPTSQQMAAAIDLQEAAS